MKYIFSFIASLWILFPTCAKNYLTKPTGQYAVGFQDFYFVEGTLENKDGPNAYYSCPGNPDEPYDPERPSRDLFYNGTNSQYFGKNNQTDFCREMMARVYYPIQKKKDLVYAIYYKPMVTSIQDFLRGMNVPELTEDKLKTLEQIKTFSVDFNGKSSNILDKKFPVLIFNPGFGAFAQEYENFIVELASNGYIVLAINNTFSANMLPFPDGRVVPIANLQGLTPERFVWILQKPILDDILFAKNTLLNKEIKLLSEFINHMQLDRVGIFGHSVAGYPIMKIARDNPNLFQAYSYFDAGAKEFANPAEYSPSAMAGFNMPFFRFNAAYWYEPEYRNDPRRKMPMDAEFELFNNNYFVLLSPNKNNYTHSCHFDFSDFATLQYHPTLQIFLEKFKMPGDPAHVQVDCNGVNITETQYTKPLSRAQSVLAVGNGDGWDESKTINAYLLEFFDKYLKNKPAKNLNKCEAFSGSILNCGSMNNVGKAIKSSRKSQKISQKQIDKS